MLNAACGRRARMCMLHSKQFNSGPEPMDAVHFTNPTLLPAFLRCRETCWANSFISRRRGGGRAYGNNGAVHVFPSRDARPGQRAGECRCVPLHRTQARGPPCQDIKRCRLSQCTLQCAYAAVQLLGRADARNMTWGEHAADAPERAGCDSEEKASEYA